MMRRRRRRFRHYVGARMHRQLFVWFGIAILATIGTVAGTFHLLGEGGRGWQRERERVQHFIVDQYARAWNEPTERHALSASLVNDMDLGVRVHDVSGASLDDLGWPASCRTHGTIALVRGGARLGTLDVCFDRHHTGPRAWLVVLALLAAGGVLWAFAGKVSRRISQPLTDLTNLAREIGEGNLGQRENLCCTYQGEVGELSDAIHDMAERIERQLRDQRELLATVSHELRTPLQRIRLLLEIADTPAADKKTLQEIDGEVMEMDALVGDLLASARIDFSALSPRRLDVDEIARRSVERCSLPNARVEIDPNTNEIMADATLVARALAALFDNARKYGGTEVLLRVAPRGDGVAFEVCDNGRGFAPGDEERVLEPFYRGRERSEQAPGIGLGLSLVRKIAEAHGGRAYAKNRPEGGACVGFELPSEPRARRPA